jgi:hypothetical protein
MITLIEGIPFQLVPQANSRSRVTFHIVKCISSRWMLLYYISGNFASNRLAFHPLLWYNIHGEQTQVTPVDAW